jgi:hypothetical protein
MLRGMGAVLFVFDQAANVILSLGAKYRRALAAVTTPWVDDFSCPRYKFHGSVSARVIYGYLSDGHSRYRREGAIEAIKNSSKAVVHDCGKR